MIGGLLLTTVLPYLLTKFGGMAVSAILLRVSGSQDVAAAGANFIGQIAGKIAGGKPLTKPEHQAWKAHIESSYTTPVEVESAPGVPFVRT